MLDADGVDRYRSGHRQEMIYYERQRGGRVPHFLARAYGRAWHVSCDGVDYIYIYMSLVKRVCVVWRCCCVVQNNIGERTIPVPLHSVTSRQKKIKLFLLVTTHHTLAGVERLVTPPKPRVDETGETILFSLWRRGFLVARGE